MRIKFRHGVVSADVNGLGNPAFLVQTPSGISIKASSRPLVLSIADGPKNYTITFDRDVTNAWSAASLSGVTNGWLYVDINRATGDRTFGIAPANWHIGMTAPTAPVVGQMWYDTRLLKSMVFTELNSWIPSHRVIVGNITSTTLACSAVGSQVGLTGMSVLSGELLLDGFGKAITDSQGRFITTEDTVIIKGAAAHAARLEANVNVAPAGATIPAFHVIRYTNAGSVVLADYDDVGACVVGMTTVDAMPGEPVSFVLQGKVYNPDWNWSGPNITLWVDRTGNLTTTDPYQLGGRIKPRVPVARTIDSKTVIFDQGLGGVGEKGDVGGSDLNVTQATTSQLGTVMISVPPLPGDLPVAVEINDPRLYNSRTPLPHTHSASTITVAPFGVFSGEQVQQALEHLNVLKLSLSGGTLTGNVSSVEATQPDHLVTLGQASIKHRRITLDDSAATIIQGYNLLSPGDRTILQNTLLVLEYKGYVYLWVGGYGTPTTATNTNQFSLIGRIISADGNVNIRTFKLTNTKRALLLTEAGDVITQENGDPLAL